MKISASIYSNKEKDLESLVKELDAHGIDMFHIDCFDASVFEDIQRIRKISKTPVDLHIIHQDPAIFFDAIKETGVEYVSIQYGKDVKLDTLPKHGRTQWGLALTMNDSLDVLGQTNTPFDFVLFMASEPGVSGKPFNAGNFQRIIQFRNQFPKMKIQVDGGVNDRIAFILRLLGVNSIVSGNYLMNREYLGAGMLNLHKAPNTAVGENDFKVADFMTGKDFLPVLSASSLTLKTGLEAIEKYGLGFALVSGDKGELKGVISNADMRREFIRNLGDLGNTSIEGMVNRTPIVINENQTLSDMLHLLNDLSFIVLFLPVVGTDGALKGAVLLNNLTRV